MGLNVNMARIIGQCQPGRYEKNGPWDHMSFLSTESELKRGYGNPAFAEDPVYKKNIEERSNILMKMYNIENKVEGALMVLKNKRNKKKTFENFNNNLKMDIFNYISLASSVSYIAGRHNNIVDGYRKCLNNL